jgi:predicted DsbA family dithiol-disulfide isomerase
VRIERLKTTYDIHVQWRFFPLHPDTPNEGMSLEDLFAGRGLDIDAMYQQMKDRMDAEGLEYGQRTHTYNSRLSQELAKWADTQPGFEAIHDALYRSYFAEGHNIGDIDVLVDVADSVGLPADDARSVLTDRMFKEAVDDDWNRARRYGITGVPTYACDGRGIVGAQPYEALEGLIREGGAELRTNGEGVG